MASEITLFEGSTKFLSKGSGSVHIKVINGRRTLLHKKMTNALFKIASDEGLEKQGYVTTRSKFNEYSGYNSNDVKHFKFVASSLTDSKVEFDVINGDNIRSVGAANLFSSVTFRSDGTLYFEIPEITKQMLSNTNHFALINMQVQATIESNYAHILYEHCLLYVEAGETPVWTIEQWKDFLEVDSEQSTYQEFKYFNNKVIKFAVNELNKISDIILEPIYHRRVRVITHISFKVQKKPQGLLDFLAIDESLDLQQKLVDVGVTEKEAERLVRNFDRERILTNHAYAMSQHEKGEIKSNLGGYVRKAIEGDWAPKPVGLAKKVKEKIIADQQKLFLKEQETRNAENEERRAENLQAQRYIDLLTEDDKTDLMESFADYLAIANAIAFGQYKKSGLRSTLVKTCLYQYVREEVLPKSEVL